MKKAILLLLILFISVNVVRALNIYRGVNFIGFGHKDSYKTAKALTSVDTIVDTRLNTICIPVTWFQNSQTANIIYARTNGFWQTPSDLALAQLIDYSKSRGLKVVLKLHINVTNGDSRTGILPASFSVWSTNNRNFVLKYASMAQLKGVDILIIGTELTGVSTNGYTDYWKTLISDVRDLYSGIITYSANWDAYSKTGFWTDLDFIGIDSYFPLLPGNIRVKEDIKKAWEFCRVAGNNYGQNWLQNLRDFSVSQNRHIVFTEIGYASTAADTATESVLAKPWGQPTGSVDLELQAKAYSAFIDVFLKEDWFDGFFVWDWRPDPNAGGYNDKDFTPQNKPAQEVLKSISLYDEDVRHEDMEVKARPTKVDYIKGDQIVFQLLAHQPGTLTLRIYNKSYSKVYEKKENLSDEEVKTISIDPDEMKSKISRGVYFYSIEFKGFEKKGKFVIIK